MTLDEARDAIGQRIIHAVTDHYIWIRVDGDETALKSAKPESLTLDAVAEPVDGAR